MPARLLVALVGLLAIASGVAVWQLSLRPPAGDDRRQIILMVAKLEQAIEQRRTSTVMRYISRDYHDGYGFDRRMIQRLVLQAARQAQPIDLVVQLGSISLEGDLATVHVEADYAVGAPVGAGESTHVSGELLLRRERGGWKVLRSDGWQGPALEP